MTTIGRGLKDLAEASGFVPGRVRRAGGGRKPLVANNPGLLRDLMALANPANGAIRCRRCVGPARACDSWRRSLWRVGTGSVTPMVAGFFSEAGFGRRPLYRIGTADTADLDRSPAEQARRLHETDTTT